MLATALKDVIEEAKDLNIMSIDGDVFTYSIFLEATGNSWLWYVVWNRPLQIMPVFGANVPRLKDGI